MITNSIGLEAEFFLRNSKGELVFPGDHDMPTDDFPLLGEIRGVHGNSREETVSNFLKEYYRLKFKAEKKALNIDIAQGWTKLDGKFYVSVIKKLEEKSVPKCENIYGHDLSEYSDSVLDPNGKLVHHKVSIGLHVHFSSSENVKKEIVTKNYESVKLPLNLGAAETFLNLFAERGESKSVVQCYCSRITKPVIRYVVEAMDKGVNERYKLDEPLRYRMPGFYESKYDGRFEYRSLPFNSKVLEGVPEIVDFAFNLLENL